MQKSLHGNSSIHHSTKSLVVPCVQLLLQTAREAMIETIPLLLISIDVGPSILCQMVELVHIIHHRHAPLLQVQKLHQLSIQHTNRNVILSKSSGKLLPSHMVVHWLHDIECAPPYTGRTQQLLCYKAHLLFFSYSEQLKLLL